MISWQIRPGELMRDYGLDYTAADRIIRFHTHLHWRRFGWIGGISLAMLMVYLGGTFLADDLGPVRPLLLGGAAVGTGLQLWLAQRAAYPAILQEAAELRAGKP